MTTRHDNKMYIIVTPFPLVELELTTISLCTLRRLARYVSVVSSDINLLYHPDLVGKRCGVRKIISAVTDPLKKSTKDPNLR